MVNSKQWMEERITNMIFQTGNACKFYYTKYFGSYGIILKGYIKTLNLCCLLLMRKFHIYLLTFLRSIHCCFFQTHVDIVLIMFSFPLLKALV